MDLISTLQNKKSFKAYKVNSKYSVSDAEQMLGVKFSDEYRLYLNMFGFVTYEGHELTGLCKGKRLNVVDVTIREREMCNSIPLNLYVIETLNVDGIVIWQSSFGNIYKTISGSQPIKICNSMLEYVNM